jgi:hypothetical protein
MKTPLLSFIFLFSFSLSAFAQITTASTIAYFGVDMLMEVFLPVMIGMLLPVP